jgi:nuclease-like protein
MTKPILWPRHLPAAVRNDPRRAAEMRVFDALSMQLGPKWVVFYSRPWLGETPTGAEIDGECDFVVAHPDHGVLCIEVKGGGISYDPIIDQWHSIDRHGFRHKIKNPVDQAKCSKHELLKKAKDERGWPKKFIRFRHGVIFPDVAAVPRHLGLDKPCELFATREDLSAIAQWVQQRLTGGTEEAMGAPGIRVLEQLLARPFQLHASLAFFGADDDQAILALTPQQFHILNAFQDLPRVAVAGGAGTGKTLLACEDARRRAEEGRRTLMTCGSVQLAEHLRASLSDTNVDVATFPELARRLGEAAGLLAKGASFPLEDTPELVFDSLAACPNLAYDAVVVDEAQDFPPSTWIAIDALAARSDLSTLHAYFDSNQRLYGELRTQFESYTLLPIRLTRNLRNTQHIHEATQRFYSGPALTADGPIGAAVYWILTDEDRITASAVEEVRRLLNVERVSPADLAVLCVDARTVQGITQRLCEYSGTALTVTTIVDFKGLERRFVVLLATRNLSDVPELAYVALSRARVHLSVSGSNGILAWLQGGAAKC